MKEIIYIGMDVHKETFTLAGVRERALRDFGRFRTAGVFMSFLGLVPGEYSGGSKRRQTAITRAGSPILKNRFWDRLLILCLKCC